MGNIDNTEQKNGLDALQVAVESFVARSGVAAVETSIADILEGHPLCDVWATLLERRDIYCVADLYGLETCDLTRIRGIGPAAVADIICAVMARQPWKYRLEGSVVSVASSQEAADDGDHAETGEDEPTLLDILADQELVDALQAQGYATFEEITALTLDELSQIEGIGDEGALVIDERIEAYLGEGQITEDAPKEELVSHIAAERVERVIDEIEPAEGPSDNEADAVEASPVEDDPAVEDEAHGEDEVSDETETSDETGSSIEDADVTEAAKTPENGNDTIGNIDEIDDESGGEDVSSLAYILRDVDCGELVAARLSKEHIASVDDLLGMSEADLRDICDVGHRTSREVRRAIENAGYVNYMTGDTEASVAPVKTDDPFAPDVFCAVPAPKPVTPQPIEPQPVQPISPAQSLQPERVSFPVIEQPYQPTAPLQPAAADLSPTPVQSATYPQSSPAPETVPASFDGGFDAFAPKRIEPEIAYQQPAATTPMPQVNDLQQTAPIPQQAGVWTPDGFVADSDEDEEIEEEDEEELALDAYRGEGMGKGKIVLIAGIGVIAVGASLVAGMMLGGVAFADTLQSIPYPII